MLDHPSVVRKLIVRTVIWTVLTALLLFLPAGTVNWPEGWIYLLLVCGLGLASGLVIAKHDPALVNERLAPPVQSNQEGCDKILLSLFFALWLMQYVVAGLDAEYYHLSEMPTWSRQPGPPAFSSAFTLFIL